MEETISRNFLTEAQRVFLTGEQERLTGAQRVFVTGAQELAGAQERFHLVRLKPLDSKREGIGE